MLVWVLLGVAVLLALGAVALIVMLRRARGRARRSEAVLEHAQSSIRALVEQDAIAEAETRIEAEARELISTADEQRAAVVRLREELDQAARAAVAEASDELQAHTLERRRTIEGIGERLQKREQNLLEQIERAE